MDWTNIEPNGAKQSLGGAERSQCARDRYAGLLDTLDF